MPNSATTFTAQAVPVDWTPLPTPILADNLPPLFEHVHPAWLQKLRGPYYDSPICSGHRSVQDWALSGDRFLKRNLARSLARRYPEIAAHKIDQLSNLLQSNLILSYLGRLLGLAELMPLAKEVHFQKTDGDRMEAFFGICHGYMKAHKPGEHKERLRHDLCLWFDALFSHTVFPIIGLCDAVPSTPVPTFRAVRSRYDYFEEQKRVKSKHVEKENREPIPLLLAEPIRYSPSVFACHVP